MVKTIMVKTKGIPEGRGPSSTKIPSHLKLYRHENRWQTPENHNPYTQISEQQASKQFPDQYKSLKTYVHLKKRLGTKTPLKKVKGVAFYPKPEPTLNSPAIIDTDYKVIILPDYKVTTNQTVKDENGKITTQKIHPSKLKLFKRFAQTAAIEHEAAHSEEPGGATEDPISVWEHTHKGTKSQAIKKYRKLKKESIADKKQDKFIKDSNKLYKTPDNPTLKYIQN